MAPHGRAAALVVGGDAVVSVEGGEECPVAGGECDNSERGRLVGVRRRWIGDRKERSASGVEGAQDRRKPGVGVQRLYAADVEPAGVEGERVHLAQLRRRERRVERPVGQQVGEPRTLDSSHAREAAPDVPAAAAVGDRRLYRAPRHSSPDRLREPGRGRDGDRRPRRGSQPRDASDVDGVPDPQDRAVADHDVAARDARRRRRGPARCGFTPSWGGSGRARGNGEAADCNSKHQRACRKLPHGQASPPGHRVLFRPPGRIRGTADRRGGKRAGGVLGHLVRLG